MTPDRRRRAGQAGRGCTPPAPSAGPGTAAGQGEWLLAPGSGLQALSFTAFSFSQEFSSACAEPAASSRLYQMTLLPPQHSGKGMGQRPRSLPAGLCSPKPRKTTQATRGKHPGDLTATGAGWMPAQAAECEPHQVSMSSLCPSPSCLRTVCKQPYKDKGRGWGQGQGRHDHKSPTSRMPPLWESLAAGGPSNGVGTHLPEGRLLLPGTCGHPGHTTGT